MVARGMGRGVVKVVVVVVIMEMMTVVVVVTVTGRADWLGCVCALQDSMIKYSVFYVYSCSCITILCVILLVSFMQS